MRTVLEVVVVGIPECWIDLTRIALLLGRPPANDNAPPANDNGRAAVVVPAE